ncbi:nickel-binding protein [Halomonas nitroreducens]|uniref:DUF4242 domain-containing protein n=1 Tax=Halomonas nitroreducens TaxID=447425 RepID=A0A3S0HVA4_9GAMM|nr:nickel-binding protein [Halomonas nitroreducens]RTR06572.1 DUF4242 domain-containing protein [Halomonas nitroreducens]
MIDIFVERDFASPLTPERVRREALAAQDLHRVAWQGSLLARDGLRLVCHFRAPDAEGTRIGLRQAGADISRLWAGTVHEASGAAGAPGNVLVVRAFTAAVELAAIQAIEDAGAACLQNHRVRFLRTFFSLDRRRMLCLYRAPDAESVRIAQRQAGMPLEAAWAFHRVSPPTSTSAASTPVS